MKISLVTICFNSKATIEDTLKSVLNQNYTNYEYVIKDGGSTDGTIDIIKKYEKKFKGKLKLIIGKDKGIYDAMNIGIKNTTGDIIGILNSDDILASDNTFKLVVDNIKDYDGIFSNLFIKDYETMSKIVRRLVSKKGNYKLGWYPPHPTLYLKREVYERYGYFDITYKIAADYDFMVRILKNGVKLNYINTELVYMRANGVSTNGLKGYKKSFDESIRALKNNKIKFPYLVNIIRTFKVLFQTLRK
jgi:glycosyltransferase involved in cell wall biosynthesis